MYYVCWQHNTNMETGRTDYSMTLQQAEDYITWQKKLTSEFRYWMEPG